MAGVGFELKKLFNEHGLTSTAKAYAFSSVTTVGPMILCMTMMIVLQWFMTINGSPFLERELFLSTVVYCFIFSVLLTGGLSMLLNRYIADMLFVKKYEHMLPSYYGAIVLCMPIGALICWLFLRDVPSSLGYKLATYLLFSELTIIWIQSVYLSALKDYKRIVRNFFYGTVVSLAGAWIVLKYTSFNAASTVVTMMSIGFFLILILNARHFHFTFPPASSKLYWSFLSYFRKYPALFFIGTFFYAGVYVHSFIYWSGPFHFWVAEKYAISPFYDLPVFYAYLTAVPTLVTFVVSVETSFYEKYKQYYARILSGGTLLDITNAKKDMNRVLMHEISFVMEVQLLFTIISIALGIKLLPMIGFTMEQLHVFNILVLGYFFFIIAFVVMLLLLYYDDRKGVLLISSLLVVLNAALSYWTMMKGYHGLGMFIASLVTLILALARIVSYVRNIDYYTFCAQPITTRRKEPLWKRWSGKSSSAAVIVLLFLILSGCTSAEDSQTAVEPQPPAPTPIAPIGLSEDKRIYERDQDNSVIPLYITILPDKPDEGKPLSWYELNRLPAETRDKNLKVIMQEGAPDGSGPKSGMFGYGTSEANGKISLRGKTARYASQRSYKIRLNDQAGFWRDQRVLNLNKHSYDSSRIRNKLSFDIFETLPNIASLRTQFVHLYVKDLSENAKASAPFVDYGLYTHIEQANETFLKNHWLDPYGQLYKAVMFEFFRYPDELKSSSDPSFDKEKFETRLEINGSDDHDKLLAMLDDVNNMSIPIDEVMAKHFDLDNYLTWLAANILMDNMDTDAQNFFLYSPLNSSKWYFLPWDYDGGWEMQRSVKSISEYSMGISNYWGSVLHNRFFRSEKNVRLLKDKIDELYTAINHDTVEKRLQVYKDIAVKYMSRMPDNQFLPIPIAKLDEEFKRISQVPVHSIERFNKDIQKPKPFFLSDLEKVEGKYILRWDIAFDLQGDDIEYDFLMAKDPEFKQIVDERKKLKVTNVTLNSLPPRNYYWKVIARDPEGHEQIAFDIYFDEKDTPYYGMKEIKVE
ncbi:exopolysaccharide Pel transporter PelG [Paenibacillus silviterrae]|uniref:exopolysaccharide Pel transporter PelG n=1 Tax=Paenibacillus silviterrae TaxID=3242194 RepID=UPI00254345F2|nr:exopolysaccharide Pel transporter PelG [Paenibacillus chinjuensis]